MAPGRQHDGLMAVSECLYVVIAMPSIGRDTTPPYLILRNEPLQGCLGPILHSVQAARPAHTLPSPTLVQLALTWTATPTEFLGCTPHPILGNNAFTVSRAPVAQGSEKPGKVYFPLARISLPLVHVVLSNKLNLTISYRVCLSGAASV